MSDKKRALPVVLVVEGGVARREVLQGLIAGLGAGIAVPGVAQQHPASHPPAAADNVRSPLEAADWKPQFLDEHQMATLNALSDRIVPGSLAAHSPRFVDALLAVETQENKRRFLSAMGAVEGEARARYQKPFRALSATEQDAVLTACSAVEPGKKEWIWTPGTPFTIPPKEPKEPEVLTIRDHFDFLKARIADAYYSSATGQKELGDQGHVFFAAFPDCQHKEHV